MNADPREFGRLLCLLVDRSISIRFEGERMLCEAERGAIDDDVLALLKRFKGPLRQAYGPERLPEIPDTPEPHS